MGGVPPAELQRPSIELVEGPLQAYIQPWIAHPHPDGLVVRVNVDPVDLQAFASLPVRLNVKEIEVEGGNPRQRQ